MTRKETYRECGFCNHAVRMLEMPGGAKSPAPDGLCRFHARQQRLREAAKVPILSLMVACPKCDVMFDRIVARGTTRQVKRTCRKCGGIWRLVFQGGRLQKIVRMK